MPFSPGDTVVHPQHGIATVKQISRRDLGNGSASYLELYIDKGSMQIMVPADAVDDVGIRRIATRKEAEQILAIFEQSSDVPEAWAERSVATKARMQSRDLDQVSMVVRDLSRHQLRTAKPLTFSEKGILDGCLDIVADELSLALDMSVQETKAVIVEKSLGGSAGHSAAS